MYYTIGQRQGLGIGGRRDAGNEPWYVAGKNLESNVLIVVQGDHPLLFSDRIEATGASWIGAPPAKIAEGQPFLCAVKLRYRQPDQWCEVVPAGAGRLLVNFEESQRAVAPGQFAVFYAGDRCLGGAVIERVRAAGDALQKTG